MYGQPATFLMLSKQAYSPLKTFRLKKRNVDGIDEALWLIELAGFLAVVAVAVELPVLIF
jgi:hypothetical protein